MTFYLRVRDWLFSRSRREQWLLGLLAALVIPLFIWATVYRPLLSAIEQAKAEHTQAVRNNGLVRARLAQLEGVRTPVVDAAASRATLAIRITESAAQAGVALSSNDSRGTSSAVVRLAPAPSTAVLRWLRQLENQGIIVREFSIIPQGDTTVIVTATLSGTSRR